MHWLTPPRGKPRSMLVLQGREGASIEARARAVALVYAEVAQSGDPLGDVAVRVTCDPATGTVRVKGRNFGLRQPGI